MQMLNKPIIQDYNYKTHRKLQKQTTMKAQENQRDILTIMEMFAVQFQQASAVYQREHQNLEKAIQQLLKKQSDQTQIRANEISNSNQQKNKQQKFRSQIHVHKMREMHKYSHQEEMQLTAEQVKQRFRTNYLIKKKSTSKRFKQQLQDSTINRLQKYLNQPISVHFLQENNDIFNELWNTHKFITVHCLSIPSSVQSKDSQEIIKRNFYNQIYCSQKFGAIFNKEFLNMVVDPSSQDFNQLKIINQFIKPKDINSIVILRLHQKTKLIVRAHSMNIINCIKPQCPQSFQKYLIHLRRDINREIQMEICPSIHHNPLSDIQKMKLDRDRKIKAQQEVAYKVMEQQIKQSKKAQKNDKTQAKIQQQKRRRNSDSQDEQIKKMKQQVMKSVQQSILKQRQVKLLQMKKYTPQQLQNPISFKIRYPNGNQVVMSLPKNETLNYIVDYITCQSQTLGFQNELRRNFVLTQPWNLTDFNDKESKTFLELFDDSNGEILIVKQIY